MSDKRNKTRFIKTIRKCLGFSEGIDYNSNDTTNLVEYFRKNTKKTVKFKKDIYFFVEKTNFEEEDSIIFVYKFLQNDKKSIGGDFVQSVMDIIKTLEIIFIGLDHTDLERELIDDRNLFSLLICVKKVCNLTDECKKELEKKEEEDILVETD